MREVRKPKVSGLLILHDAKYFPYPEPDLAREYKRGETVLFTNYGRLFYELSTWGTLEYEGLQGGIYKSKIVETFARRFGLELHCQMVARQACRLDDCGGDQPHWEQVLKPTAQADIRALVNGDISPWQSL